jgi:pyruvate-formate lyase-activating enzyme
MKIHDLNLPDHFCPLPFTYIYSEHRGNWKPCCKTHVYPQKQISFDEWWYEDEDLNNLRDAMLNDSPSQLLDDVCSPCRSLESVGIKSHREHILESYNDFRLSKLLSDLIKAYNRTGLALMPPDQRLYTIKVRGFGNHCNLKCYMCYPVNSSSRMNEMKNVSDESINIFFKTNSTNPKSKLEKHRKLVMDVSDEKRNVYDAIESVSSNILNLNLTGGEPVMIEEYYNLMDKFIETGDAKHINIFMNTNLSKFGFKDKSILDYIDQFKTFDIQASIDDLFERDEWIRYPSKFNEVLDNYKTLKQYSNVKIKVNITWSILNISNAEKILKFFKDQNMEVNKNLNFVYSPVELSVKNYPFKEDLINRYSKSNNAILNELAKALSEEFNQEQFDAAIRYINDMDRFRNIKSYQVFPELSQFLT